jgi:hypothetical protein
MVYKFATIEGGNIQKHVFDTYAEARKWVDQEIETFKMMNHVKDESKDRYFMQYRDQLEKMLEKPEER